jgi:RNA polymerase sigma factor (sigma-70 family)
MQIQGMMTRQFQEDLELLYPRLRSVLMKYRIPSADADDILQDAVLSLVEHKDRIENAQAWLLTVVRFRCSIFHRRQVRWNRLILPMDPADLQALAKPLSPPQEHRDICCDINRLVRKLKADELRMLRQYFFQELGRKQLAIQFGCHPANVPKVMRRILARLKTAAQATTL